MNREEVFFSKGPCFHIAYTDPDANALTETRVNQ